MKRKSEDNQKDHESVPYVSIFNPEAQIQMDNYLNVLPNLGKKTKTNN